MANFEKALQHIFAVEGGYTDDPADSGGRTNYGISEAHHPEAWEDGEVSIEEAKEIYRADYWDPLWLDRVESQKVARRLFDIAVNTGKGTGVEIAQRAANIFPDTNIAEDGVMGPNTLYALNSNPEGPLEALMRLEQARYYLAIVRSDPSQKKFLVGWLNRALRW